MQVIRQGLIRETQSTRIYPLPYEVRHYVAECRCGWRSSGRWKALCEAVEAHEAVCDGTGVRDGEASG